jgi:hypothetical protein
MLSSGAPSAKTSCFSLKIIIGGTYMPSALQQQTTVVLTPLSALDTEPVHILDLTSIETVT